MCLFTDLRLIHSFLNLQQMQAEPVDTETYPASPHSSWALDTAPEEQHGELSLFNDFRQLQCGCA